MGSKTIARFARGDSDTPTMLILPLTYRVRVQDRVMPGFRVLCGKDSQECVSEAVAWLGPSEITTLSHHKHADGDRIFEMWTLQRSHTIPDV